jgi:hypothetical protein
VSGTLTYSLPARERAASAAERIERLYGACRDDLYAYLATLLGDHSAAEEVTALARASWSYCGARAIRATGPDTAW